MPPRSTSNSVPVYSTEQGRMCPKCGKPDASCACQRTKAAPKGDGVVRVARQTKGRKGKGVCLVTGLPLSGEDLEKLARQLKQRLGAGGAVKDGVVEIQGDRREALVQELAKLGYKAKLAGG
ncbi:translation initiation factor Sui1 [Fundidesulfovibrio butyratiphilus]